MDQISYIETIKPVPVSKQQSMMRHEPLNENELKQFRSVIGQLGWAAGQTSPDIAFDCCELSSLVKHATIEDLLRANKALSRAKSELIVLTFKDMGDLSTAKFVCFNDSSFGNLCDGCSQGDYVIFLEGQNGNCSPLMWQSKKLQRLVRQSKKLQRLVRQSKKLQRVVRSTMAAETLSQVEAAEACFWLSGILKEILFDSQDRSPQYNTECRTDSHQLYDAVYSIRPVLEKRLRIDIAILKKMIERKEVTHIKWIYKKYQLADSLTKRGVSPHNLIRVFDERKL